MRTRISLFSPNAPVYQGRLHVQTMPHERGGGASRASEKGDSVSARGHAARPAGLDKAAANRAAGHRAPERREAIPCPPGVRCVAFWLAFRGWPHRFWRILPPNPLTGGAADNGSAGLACRRDTTSSGRDADHWITQPFPRRTWTRTRPVRTGQGTACQNPLLLRWAANQLNCVGRQGTSSPASIILAGSSGLRVSALRRNGLASNFRMSVACMCRPNVRNSL